MCHYDTCGTVDDLHVCHYDDVCDTDTTCPTESYVFEELYFCDAYIVSFVEMCHILMYKHAIMMTRVF